MLAVVGDKHGDAVEFDGEQAAEASLPRNGLLLIFASSDFK